MNTEAITLTPSELIFARRMLPHFLAGKSAEEAAEAVLDDDAWILGACFSRSGNHFVATADERGFAYRDSDRAGDVIAAEITRTVYAALRAA